MKAPRLLAAVVLALLPTLLVGVQPAAALCVGSSLCNPANAPLLAEFATSAGPTLTTAATTGGYLTGPSVAAAVAANPLSTPALAAGASSSVWGAAVGKVVTLLGGLAAWKFIAPDTGEPGLPAGPPSGGGTGSVSVSGYAYSVSVSATATANPLGGGNTTSIPVSWSRTTAAQNVYLRALGHKVSDGTWEQVVGWGVYIAAGGSGSGSSIMAATLGTPGTYDQVRYEAGVGPYFPPTAQAWSTAPGVTYLLGAPSSNPARYIQQTVTCKRADGSTSTVTSSTTAAPMTAGAMVDVAGLMCPSGARAVGVNATVKTTGGSDLVVVDAPYVPGTGLDVTTGSIPEPCYTGSTQCYLDLQRATSPDGSAYASVDPGDYPGWWTDPNRDVLYRCRYGTASTWLVVPISSCSVYKDGGDPLNDPVPTTDTPTPDPASDCNFGWSDLLTGGIFVRGGKCVLTWAFVPADGFMSAKVEQVRTSWEGTAPLVVFNTANSVWSPWYQARSVPSGCEGPSFSITNMVSNAHPFSACGEIAQAVVPVGKPLIAGVVLVGAVLGAARTLGRSFGIDASSRGEPM